MNGVYQATVETAKAYIDQNLGRDLSVEKLAAVTGYSVSRFAHIFQEQTQMSVKEYVTEQRLYQAAKMILEGETIVNAALECGFDTHSGFAKAYRNKMGYPPSFLGMLKKRAARAKLSMRLLKQLPELVSMGYMPNTDNGVDLMLKPYIVEKDIIRIIGKRVSFMGDDVGKIGMLWEEMDQILKAIPNRVDQNFFGISLDFWHADREKGLCSYMIGAEVSDLTDLPDDMESLAVPASRWLYIPVRYDDETVKGLAPEELNEDMPYVTGCVFGWSRRYIAEQGLKRQDFPIEYEIYGLTDGYEEQGGAHLTLAVPII